MSDRDLAVSIIDRIWQENAELRQIIKRYKENKSMTELHMRAYYWTFEPTGEICADRILSAVASAGKAAHNTSEWANENDGRYYGQEGARPWEWIENAAKATAQEVRELRAIIRRYEENDENDRMDAIFERQLRPQGQR